MRIHQLDPAARLLAYGLGQSLLTEELVRDHVSQALGFSAVQKSGGLMTAIDGPRRLEADLSIGRLWFRDTARLWNPSHVPAALPSDEECYTRAEKTFADLRLMPALARDLTFSREWVDSTRVREFVSGKGTSAVALDRHAAFALRVQGPIGQVPVMGLGGKAGITFTEGLEAIGLNYSVRPVGDPVVDGPIVLPSIVSDGGDIDFQLAYALGRYREQAVLYPVWVIGQSIRLGDVSFGARRILQPAIKLADPVKRWVQPAIQRGREIPLTKDQRPDPTAGIVWRDLGADTDSKANAHGFARAIIKAGWQQSFERDDQLSKLTDWYGRDKVTDTVDLVFFSGHAGPSGWSVSPREGFYWQYGKDPSGRFGDSNLEWLVIAGCGPLQDDNIDGTGADVFSWRQVFSGLHGLLGYACSTTDFEEEGQYFVSHGTIGACVVDAWFCTARDLQSLTFSKGVNTGSAPVWVAAVLPLIKGEGDTRNDGFWGFGKVAPDPRGASDFVALWVPA